MGKINLPVPKIPTTTPPRNQPMRPVQTPDSYTTEVTTPANNPQRRPPMPDAPTKPSSN